jgi:ATPase family associated with various cellular activities (AAA)
LATAQAPDPLRLRPHGLDFDGLRDLSEYLERVQEDADASLEYFRHREIGGFAHRVDPAVGPQKSSKASTATCLTYLRAAGKLSGEGWDDETRDRLRSFMTDDKWSSADLPENNAFTSAFLLESIHALGGREGLDPERGTKIDQKIGVLNRALAQHGGLSIAHYPPTAFLTYKVVRSLTLWDRLDPQARREAAKWTWNHLYEESMLIASESPDADVFELAYAVLTASVTSRLDRMTPRERRLLRHAIDQFFSRQRDDGTWPRSRPLFLYPNIGYAYCYDYELLAPLISDRQLAQLVFPRLAELRNAAWALDSRRVPLEHDERAFGWSSEHHGGNFEAESWPTASVFHFCFELGRLVSDAIRRDVFEYVDATYDEPETAAPTETPLAGLMDSQIVYNGGSGSFKELFGKNFLEPLIRDRDAVRDGRSFAADTKASAIIYGPPGTSKTRLATMVAKALGWPLLALDPSHLTRRGMDSVHAEADALFGRLRLCDQIVVLMDEFDELVRERAAAGELASRFLTTAMLPKIAALHARRRIVYLVATNHLEVFDAAISRPGRFDVIVPLMPPTAEAKLASAGFASLAEARDLLSNADPPMADIDAIIADLTYAETEDLALQVGGETKVDKLRALVERAASACTLNQRVLDTERPAESPPGATDTDPQGTPAAEEERAGAATRETWKVQIAKQKSKIRGLGL